ncbi:MAG: HEAT repeat domain-containing protein [Elusimicrobiota bacterium]
MRLLAAVLFVVAPLFAADAPSYLSRNGSFALTIPAPYRPRFIPWINLDIVGWELEGDHSVAGAVWRMNHDVYRRFGGSAEDAARFIQSTHMCGDHVCGSTPLSTQELPNGGTLSFYELRDPSIPSDRGVLSGIARSGDEFYRVQGVNYDPLKPSRAQLLGILRGLRAAPGADARPVPIPNGAGSGDDWGIRFSGESDLSLMQDMHSSSPMPPVPPAPAVSTVTLRVAARTKPRRPEKFPAPAVLPKTKPKAAVKPRAPAAKRRAAPAKTAKAAPAGPQSFPVLPPVPPHESPALPSGKTYEDLDERLQHDALPDLIEMLRHENPRVRARVADLIGQRGESAAAAVPRLMENLDDKDDRARSSAAMALGNIGAPARGAIPKLKKMDHDPNPDARMSARNALEELSAL